MVDLSATDNIFLSQPCRDNTLYLLKLIDEMLISEIDKELPVLGFPTILMCGLFIIYTIEYCEEDKLNVRRLRHPQKNTKNQRWTSVQQDTQILLRHSALYRCPHNTLLSS